MSQEIPESSWTDYLTLDMLLNMLSPGNSGDSSVDKECLPYKHKDLASKPNLNVVASTCNPIAEQVKTNGCSRMELGKKTQTPKLDSTLE